MSSSFCCNFVHYLLNVTCLHPSLFLQCETSQGIEATRISIVDKNGTVLFDQLILPRNPIVDYKTEFVVVNLHLWDF